MKEQALFRPDRFCIVCGCKASNGRKQRDPNEPVMIAVTPVLYRRGAGKGQLRNAPRVNVCQDCLSKAATNGRLNWFQGESPLWLALRTSLLDCLSKMVDTDAFDAVKRPDWQNPSQELPL